MSSDSDEGLLLDMLTTARDVRLFVEGLTWDEFSRNIEKQFAVRLGLQIIGEAARKVSMGTRNAYPGIPWHVIVGMRHRLVHDYRQVNPVRIWDTFENHLPALIAALEPFFPVEEP